MRFLIRAYATKTGSRTAIVKIKVGAVQTERSFTIQPIEEKELDSLVCMIFDFDL